MTAIAVQKDLLGAFKKTTVANLEILSKLQYMSAELSGLFKDNALEKPSQNLFNHISYYFISIIDANASASLTWPLYDTNSERAFRKELASFILDYSSKGLLSPVLSSYLINPGCYKVTQLLLQLSQLAVDKMLLKKERQKEIYTLVKEKFKSKDKDGINECLKKHNQVLLCKISNYRSKRKAMEKMAELLRNKIIKMDAKLASTNANKYICDLVDRFLKQHEVDEKTKLELSKKNVHVQSTIFDTWLEEVDRAVGDMENTWDARVSPLLQSCQTLYQATEELVGRHVGKCDRSSYTMEYNHTTDALCTQDLQTFVNSEQKYVLKNIVNNERLSFPNLVRGFAILMSVTIKDYVMGDEIYKFNEYLAGGRGRYSELVSAMRDLNERVDRAEKNLHSLQTNKVYYDQSLYIKDMPGAKALPCLSNLKACRDPNQVLFNTFTPLKSSKYRLNLKRKTSTTILDRPVLLSSIKPFYTAPREDFLKSISRHSSKYDQTREESNISIIPHLNTANETIANTSSGFTKQKILQLISAKTRSSSKKHKLKVNRHNIDVKKGPLFHATVTPKERSNESISNVLFRCHSSPNLFENREKRYSKGRGRQLSIMQEDSYSPILEMSGTAAIDANIHNSMQNHFAADTSSMPAMVITSDIPNVKLNLDTEIDTESIPSPNLEETGKSFGNNEKSSETPKGDVKIIKITSSVEKIINRLNKVRAKPNQGIKSNIDNLMEFNTDEEENTQFGSPAVPTPRLLLPDLLSPSCSKPY